MFYLGLLLQKKYHKLGGLNNRNVFLTVLRTGKFQDQARSWPNQFVVYSHMVQGGSEAGRESFLVSLLRRALLPSWEPHQSPNYLPKSSSPNTIMLGIRVSRCKFWEDTNTKPMAPGWSSFLASVVLSPTLLADHQCIQRRVNNVISTFNCFHEDILCTP